MAGAKKRASRANGRGRGTSASQASNTNQVSLTTPINNVRTQRQSAGRGQLNQTFPIRERRECWTCGSLQHIARNCPEIREYIASGEIYRNSSGKLCIGPKSQNGPMIQRPRNSEKYLIDTVREAVEAKRKADEVAMKAVKKKIETPSNKPWLTLLGMPPEMRNEIYKATLTHTGPVFVSPFWNTLRTPLQPELDYRLLHSCHQIFAEAYGLYLSENIWEIDISYFRLSAHLTGTDEGPTPDAADRRWPLSTGQIIEAQLVRRVAVWTHELRYDKSPQLLRGFESNLEEIIFDLRSREDIILQKQACRRDATETMEACLLRSGVIFTVGCVSIMGEPKIGSLEDAIEGIESDLEEAARVWEVTQGLQNP